MTTMEQQNCEEHTFLFGAKKIRCYGSIDDLNNSPSTSTPKITRIVVHKVQPTDTLQSLELRYNSSMFDIKRLNKLWSNQSLYCKTEVLIPIFDESGATEDASGGFSQTPKELTRLKDEKVEKKEEESLDQLLKRIDMNMKRTKKAVKRLHQRVSRQDNDELV